MANKDGPKEFQIKIESVLGGISAYSDFARKDQFRMSYSVDPDQSYATDSIASGLLRPVGYQKFSGTTITAAPMWMTANPKDATVLVYDVAGSVYSFDSSFSPIGLTDLNDGGTAAGNGLAYYDNYVYAARSTTIARYGPLNGTPSWTDDYWSATLGKTALSNTTYPNFTGNSLMMPNHPMLRHNDGKLYIADVVGNQGVLHYIKTTKTTVEGDTIETASQSALDFPYGYWPTALATYGTDIAIALYEGSTNNSILQRRAKLSFWDTVNPNTYNKLIDVEFPDPIITALLNSNGVLYTFSGQLGLRGTRICRFVGGYSFEQVAYIEEAFPPSQAAVDGFLNRVVFGSRITTYVDRGGSVFSIGSKKSAISNEIFSIMGCSPTDASTAITCLGFFEQAGTGVQRMITGWNIGGSTGGSNNGLDRQNGQNIAYFSSQKYRLGQPFKITKVRFPLVEASGSNNIIPTFYIDNSTTTTTLTSINSTSYPNQQTVVLRPENLTGRHTFQLEIKWDSSTTPISLPITIEGEFLED